MNTTRIEYLRSELLEIDAIAAECGINITDDMQASDILDAISDLSSILLHYSKKLTEVK